MIVYDKSGIKYEMAQNIVGALGELGFREIGVQARPGLVVLRKTKMPALLIETGFINSDEDNILYDEKQKEIAQAIAGAFVLSGADWCFPEKRKCRQDALPVAGSGISGVYPSGRRFL